MRIQSSSHCFCGHFKLKMIGSVIMECYSNIIIYDLMRPLSFLQVIGTWQDEFSRKKVDVTSWLYILYFEASVFEAFFMVQ